MKVKTVGAAIAIAIGVLGVANFICVHLSKSEYSISTDELEIMLGVQDSSTLPSVWEAHGMDKLVLAIIVMVLGAWAAVTDKVIIPSVFLSACAVVIWTNWAGGSFVAIPLLVAIAMIVSGALLSR